LVTSLWRRWRGVSRFWRAIAVAFPNPNWACLIFFPCAPSNVSRGISTPATIRVLLFRHRTLATGPRRFADCSRTDATLKRFPPPPGRQRSISSLARRVERFEEYFWRIAVRGERDGKDHHRNAGAVARVIARRSDLAAIVTVGPKARGEKEIRASHHSEEGTARREKSLPLTFVQERLWFWTSFIRVIPPTTFVGVVRIAGMSSEHLVAKAINAIVARHESCRNAL